MRNAITIAVLTVMLAMNMSLAAQDVAVIAPDSLVAKPAVEETLTQVADTVATSESGESRLSKARMAINKSKSKIARWFNLDSLAARGRFLNFCVDVYRWGDRAFNTYDTAYVVGTGYRWNIKLRNDNWMDGYSFNIESDLIDGKLRMNSEVSSTIGLSLTFMAVTVGYNINISRLFYGRKTGRKLFNFNFCSSRLAVDFNLSKNNSFTKIRKSIDSDTPGVYFHGVENNSMVLNAYYFFNNFKYAQAAAYNYSKIQRRSAGSIIAGFSVNLQDLNMDFSEVINENPSLAPLRDFRLKSNNYTFIFGYGYNWVPNRHWVFNVTATPAVGWRYGEQSYSEVANKHYSFSFNAYAKLGATYNLNRWFISLLGQMNMALYAEKRYTFVSLLGNLTLLGGFRF